MTEHRVEPATVGDAPAIHALARRTWHAAYDDILGAATVDAVVDDWYAVDSLEESITAQDHGFAVARADDLRGFAHAGPHGEGDGWALYRLYVDPEHWGEGVGSDLLAYVEADLRERGADSYELGVLADNEVGVAFYEARGFERVETTTVALGGVETTEYTYRKTL